MEDIQTSAESTIVRSQSVGQGRKVVWTKTETTFEGIEGTPHHTVSIHDENKVDMTGRPQTEGVFGGSVAETAQRKFQEAVEDQLPGEQPLQRASFLVALNPVSGNRTWFTTAVQMKPGESLHDVRVEKRVQRKVAESDYVEDNSVDFIAPLHTFPEIDHELDYITMKVREDGNMYFTADGEQMEALEEAVKETGKEDNPNEAWNELIMPIICNSSLMQIPEGMVGLTSDPFMLSDEVDHTEDPYDPVFMGRVFSYRSYQVMEPLYELMQTGEVVFNSFD